MKLNNEKLNKLGYTHKSKIKLGKYKIYYLCYGKGKRQEYEHRLVYEAEFGPIPAGYIVHHKDGNGLNNSIDNLQIMSRSEHMWTHGKKVYLDGELVTLTDIKDRFNYYDEANVIHAIQNYMKTKSARSRLSGHIIQYQDE